MAETLRRLVNIGTFNVLQDKLERWQDEYYINSCDLNVARGCEIVELTAKVQSQLFRLLSVCASEGGMYGGASVIKSRLLPWLGQNCFSAASLSTDTSLDVLLESSAKNREISDMQDSLRDLEDELRDSKLENQDLKDELEDTRKELSLNICSTTGDKRFKEKEINELRRKLQDAKDEFNRSLRSSTSDKMFSEVELRELRRKLSVAEEENRALRTKAGLLSDHESQIRRLRDDIALLTARRDTLTRYPKDDIYLTRLTEAQDEIVKLRAKSGLFPGYERQIQQLKDELSLLTSKRSTYIPTEHWCVKCDYDDSFSTYRYIPRGTGSPLSVDDPVQRVRQQNLISRWNDLFSQDRLDAMDTLRRFSDDHENNQRIIFSAVQESYNVAKLAFRQFKMKVRANLAGTCYGPETLEEAVQDYINRNTDLNDLPGMVSDVIRALNRNPKIFLPPDNSFAIIQPFIREAVKLAWQMSALAHPMDIAISTDAELYDLNRYRRSYDSEYTAPLVNHHIWPCLNQGTRVIMKGEAVTRRGASLVSRRGRSPMRSLSPGLRSRSVSPLRARSRSPSPRRSRSPFRSASPYRSSSPLRY